MSRWTMPLPCAASSAEATCDAYSSAFATGSCLQPDQRVEPSAVHQLHGDERRPVVLVDLVDRDDVRVIEGGGGAGFLDEPAVAIGIGRRLGRQHLDRDRPAEPGVVGGVDNPHAAAANLGVDAIVGNLVWH